MYKILISIKLEKFLEPDFSDDLSSIALEFIQLSDHNYSYAGNQNKTLTCPIDYLSVENMIYVNFFLLSHLNLKL